MDTQTIYVLPTEPGLPPRAIVGTEVEEDGQQGIVGPMLVFSRDSGCWMLSGTPVDADLNDAISGHARSLGIDI